MSANFNDESDDKLPSLILEMLKNLNGRLVLLEEKVADIERMVNADND